MTKEQIRLARELKNMFHASYDALECMDPEGLRNNSSKFILSNPVIKDLSDTYTRSRYWFIVYTGRMPWLVDMKELSLSKPAKWVVEFIPGRIMEAM